jgi:hypothetical protein
MWLNFSFKTLVLLNVSTHCHKEAHIWSCVAAHGSWQKSMSNRVRLVACDFNATGQFKFGLYLNQRSIGASRFTPVVSFPWRRSIQVQSDSTRAVTDEQRSVAGGGEP